MAIKCSAASAKRSWPTAARKLKRRKLPTVCVARLPHPLCPAFALPPSSPLAYPTSFNLNAALFNLPESDAALLRAVVKHHRPFRSSVKSRRLFPAADVASALPKASGQSGASLTQASVGPLRNRRSEGQTDTNAVRPLAMQTTVRQEASDGAEPASPGTAGSKGSVLGYGSEKRLEPSWNVPFTEVGQ
jgi:hypothetical protein